MIRGMKKLFFLFLAVALSATALASPTGNKMGEQRDVLIKTVFFVFGSSAVSDSPGISYREQDGGAKRCVDYEQESEC